MNEHVHSTYELNTKFTPTHWYKCNVASRKITSLHKHHLPSSTTKKSIWELYLQAAAASLINASSRLLDVHESMATTPPEHRGDEWPLLRVSTDAITHSTKAKKSLLAWSTWNHGYQESSSSALGLRCVVCVSSLFHHPLFIQKLHWLRWSKKPILGSWGWRKIPCTWARSVGDFFYQLDESDN